MELMWDEKRVLALANWRNEGGVYQEGEEHTGSWGVAGE